MDPGFANDLIPFALAGTCQRIEQVRCMEIADYASYDGATVMFDVMGFGTQPDEIPLQLQPGMLSVGWRPPVRQLAAGLGIEVDEITETYEREHAAEAFDIAAGHLPRAAKPRYGSKSAAWSKATRHRHRARQPVAGRPTPRLAPARPARRLLPRRNQRRTVLHRDIMPTSRKGDHNHAAIVAAAGRIVNAIPAVVAAAPGIRTTLDLPLITGKGIYAAD